MEIRPDSRLMAIYRPGAQGEVQLPVDRVEVHGDALAAVSGHGRHFAQLTPDGFGFESEHEIAEILPRAGGYVLRTSHGLVGLDESGQTVGSLDFGSFGFQRRVVPWGEGLALLNEGAVTFLNPALEPQKRVELGFMASSLRRVGNHLLAHEGYPGRLARVTPEGAELLSPDALPGARSGPDGTLWWVEGQSQRFSPRTVVGSSRFEGTVHTAGVVPLADGSVLLWEKDGFSRRSPDGQGSAFLPTPGLMRGFYLGHERAYALTLHEQKWRLYDLEQGPRVVAERDHEFFPVPMADGSIEVLEPGKLQLSGEPACARIQLDGMCGSDLECSRAAYEAEARRRFGPPELPGWELSHGVLRRPAAVEAPGSGRQTGLAGASWLEPELVERDGPIYLKPREGAVFTDGVKLGDSLALATSDGELVWSDPDGATFRYQLGSPIRRFELLEDRLHAVTERGDVGVLVLMGEEAPHGGVRETEGAVFVGAVRVKKREPRSG